MKCPVGIAHEMSAFERDGVNHDVLRKGASHDFISRYRNGAGNEKARSDFESAEWRD